MNKKNIFVIFFMILISITFSACGYEMVADVTESNAKVKYKFFVTHAEESSILSDINKKATPSFSSFNEFAEHLGLKKGKTKKIAKQVNTVYTISTSYNKNEFDNIFLHFDKNYATISSDDISTKLASNYKSFVNVKKLKNKYCVFTIKYPYKVYKTNGKLKKDGRTVVYNLSKIDKKDKKLWAVFNSKINIKPILKGITSSSSYTNKSINIKLNTITSSFTINGIEKYNNSYKLTKQGKYTISYLSINGKKYTKKIIIDKTKPTTNIKNKTYKKKVRIEFSDKLSGIKYAKLNNKKIKNKTYINKKGNYTLKIVDKAGNVKKVNFKVS